MSVGTQTFRGKSSPDTSGVRFFESTQTVTIPGTEQTLISETVGAGLNINLLDCQVSCVREGLLKIYVNSAVIGSARTGPGNPNALFLWTPFHTVLVGETIAVKFTASSWTPVTNVEVYLQGREISA